MIDRGCIRFRLAGFQCLLALVATILLAAPALAQGFMIKPMRMEASPRAGQTIEVPLEIRNTAGDAARRINLSLVELSQTATGSWAIAADGQASSSSIAWTSLSESSVEVEPLQKADVMVRFSPPANARGAYAVGVIAETPAPEQATGLTVRMRFLIPVIVEIQGRAVRQQIRLDDVVMTYSDGSDGKTAGTEAHLRVVNAGQTYSRVGGRLSIERKNGERWRTVTRFDVPERSIIPGVTLELGQDLERRLPSGEYRLHGELFVDGRRLAPVEKEIAFVGDPGATLAYDTALLLEPEMVDMEIVPGATRTATLRIENPGTDPIKVKMAAKTPRGLAGVEMGTLSGVELSAEPWTSILPSEFTIRPGGKQNVRVMSRVPREGVDHPNYYADLVLSGNYMDGQSAGETRSMIHLSQKGVESKPNGLVEQISLAEDEEPSRYIADVQFTNVGNIHLHPEAQLALVSPQGAEVRIVALSGEEGLLLPLGKRTFGGEIDLEGIEPGYYTLRAKVTAGGNMQFVRREILLVEKKEQVGADGASSMVTRATIMDPNSVPKNINLEIGEPILPVDDPKNESRGEAG